MTKTQVDRWYRKLWQNLTKGDGYQPFGYDRVTMEAIHPGFTQAIRRLKELYDSAM